jgi:hypothetical protein
MCVTAELMRDGPSEPAGGSRFQTTFGGCGHSPTSGITGPAYQSLSASREVRLRKSVSPAAIAHGR